MSVQTATNGAQWDQLIKGGTVFLGDGKAPQSLDVAICGDRIAEIGPDLPAGRSARNIDATGRWVMPGLLNIHTHLDLEVELVPGLPEAVRHGTTTVIAGNCSIGTAFGAQRQNGQDPIVDCFARVENVPKRVLGKCAEKMHWNDTGAYLEHLDQLPLGPNMAALVPHSMLRIQVMGLQDSIRRKPGRAELQEMCRLLEKAVEEGYIGFSSDTLPFHYLANEPNTDKRIPSQHASLYELKRLTDVLRKHDRIWQTTPMSDNPLGVLLRFGLTARRFFGKALRISALAALDFHYNPGAIRGILFLTRQLNNRFFGGDFHMQALAAPFKLWGDGPITPLLEEFPAISRLIAKDIEDVEGRRALLEDPGYVADFKKDWLAGKTGRRLRRVGSFSRDFRDMRIDRCPLPGWHGQTLQEPYQRLLQYQQNPGIPPALDAEEAAFFDSFPQVEDEADFLVHVLRCWDLKLRWYSVIANSDPEVVKQLLFEEPHVLPGFNDSGAHLNNLAFFDANLMTLKLAAEESMETVARAVQRLTSEPAHFFGPDVGRLEPGKQADLAIIDPEALKHHDCDANRILVYRDDLECEQLVNRSDGVVTETLIAGQLAWQNSACSTDLGRKKMGRALRFSPRS